MHSEKEECQRRNVVKDFCYPNENNAQMVLEKLSEEDRQEVLYGQKDSLRKSVFVFTM
jgi:hypothetical protein